MIPRLRIWLCALLLTFVVETTFGAPPISTADPDSFFTMVASRLLSSQMGIKLSCIQIYPTSQYSPAVNRLLQVTANIYDATTTNYYPSVFRPVFWKTNTLDSYSNPVTNIYIVGYQYVQEPLTNGLPIFITPTDPDSPMIPFGLSTNNIYGIPWILGVKKGLPNFNALEMVNAFHIARELQFTRNTTSSSGRIYTTNQMYIMSVSNYLGTEFWNSYASNFNNQVTIVARDNLSVVMTVTNGNFGGVVLPFSEYQEPLPMSGVTNVTSWSGYLPPTIVSPSFMLPLVTNTVWLTNSVFFYGPGTVTQSGYTFNGPSFIPTFLDQSNFLDSGTPPLPQFTLLITNRLQAYIIDSNDCILDYVQLGGMDSSLNINQAIADPDSTGMWSTNFYNGGTSPQGVIQQYFISSTGGSVPTEDIDGGSWTTTPVPGAGGDISPGAQQAFFSAFFSPNNMVDDEQDGNIPITNLNLAVLAPYTPSRTIVQKLVYAANDPLVHYLSSDMYDPISSSNGPRVLDNPPLSKLSVLSDRYMPWGNSQNQMPATYTFPGSGLTVATDHGNPYNLAYKDPWVFSPDDWNFPSNETLNASWLGQVHRGTPWQTIYLKSSNILDWASFSGPATWSVWTGDLDTTDAFAMAPPADWHMASYLASLFDTNNYASLFSVNSSPAAWENLFNGMTVVSNDLSNLIVGVIPALGFTPFVISSNSVQAALLASAIQSEQATQQDQLYVNVGDIFAVPQLSTTSPYLNLSSAQIQHGLNDEAYEAIPQQLLPLLRVDSIGSVVPANGRTVIQFTGDDNHAYVVQISSDLKNWTTVSTNCPVNGSFAITNAGGESAQFYRTVLGQ